MFRVHRGPIRRSAPAEDPIAAQAEFLVQRMNENHADSIIAYARYFGEISDRSPEATARMVDIDSKGFKVIYKANAEAEEQEVWVQYPHRSIVTDRAQVRQVLIDLAEEAATALGMSIKRDSDVRKTANAASEEEGAFIQPWWNWSVVSLTAILIVSLAAWMSPPAAPAPIQFLIKTFGQDFIRFIFHALVLIHVGEASYAVYLTLQLRASLSAKLFYVFFTFFAGFPMLTPLIQTVKRQRAKQH